MKICENRSKDKVFYSPQWITNKNFALAREIIHDHDFSDIAIYFA